MLAVQKLITGNCAIFLQMQVSYNCNNRKELIPVIGNISSSKNTFLILYNTQF